MSTVLMKEITLIFGVVAFLTYESELFALFVDANGVTWISIHTLWIAVHLQYNNDPIFNLYY